MISADALGNRPDFPEIYFSRISRRAGNDDFRPMFFRQRREFFVINQAALRIGAVLNRLKNLSGKIRLMAVSQVATAGKGKSQNVGFEFLFRRPATGRLTKRNKSPDWPANRNTADVDGPASGFQPENFQGALLGQLLNRVATNVARIIPLFRIPSEYLLVKGEPKNRKTSGEA